jgi:hypothetical protein
MNVYIHRGPGHYTGSIVIAIAKNRDAASPMLRKALIADGLPHEPLNVTEYPIEQGIILSEFGEP